MSLFWKNAKARLSRKKQLRDVRQPSAVRGEDLSESETTVLTGANYLQQFGGSGDPASEADTTLLRPVPATDILASPAAEIASEPEQEAEDGTAAPDNLQIYPENTKDNVSPNGGLQKDYTTILGKNESNLFEPQQKLAEAYACIIRANTGDVVQIDQSVFRIGSGESLVEYRVDNSRISRTHASIILHESQCFLMDHQSTNGTFLEGVRLKPFERQALRNGSIFSLADEPFQFFMKDRRG